MKCEGRCDIDQKDACRVKSAEGFRCTLPRGHEGEHIACSDHHHNIKSWHNEEGRVLNLKMRVDFYAGTNLIDSVKEAIELKSRLGISAVAYGFNGIEIVVLADCLPEVREEEIQLLYEGRQTGSSIIISNSVVI